MDSVATILSSPFRTLELPVAQADSSGLSRLKTSALKVELRSAPRAHGAMVEARLAASLLVLALAAGTVRCVDKNNFKTCEQASFCKRNRKLEPNHSPYTVDPASISAGGSTVTFTIPNSETSVPLSVTLTALKDATIRMRVTDPNSRFPRYEPQEVVPVEPATAPMKITVQVRVSLHACVRVPFLHSTHAPAPLGVVGDLLPNLPPPCPTGG